MREYEIEHKEEDNHPISHNKMTTDDINLYLSASQELSDTVNSIEKQIKNFDKKILSTFILLTLSTIPLYYINKHLSVSLAFILVMSFFIYDLSWNEIQQKKLLKLKTFNIFQYKLHSLFKNHSLVNVFEKIPNHYHHSNKDIADKCRFKISDFFKNINNQKITKKELDFFIKQDSFINYIKKEKIKKEKIEFIKNLQ